MSKVKIKSAVLYLILFIGVLLIVFPLLFVFYSSFKTQNEIFSGPFALPTNFHMDQYIELFTKYNILTTFKNSLIYSVIGCVGTLVLVTPAAYAIIRMKWRLSKVALAFIMSGIMISSHAIVIPLFIVSSKLDISRTIILNVVYIATSIPSSLFILTGFVEGIPRSMEESAVIEGASLQCSFYRIISPMLKPALATITILNFNSIWNDYMLALIFVDNNKAKTLPLLIASFSGQYTTNYTLMLSAIVVAFIPSVIVAATMSDKIANGMVTGAIKG